MHPMSQRNTLDMKQGSIFKKLFTFEIPLLFTLVGQNLYNAADRVVVGHFAVNGEFSLAAIGSTSSLTALLINMSSGLASGLNVRCANLWGANKKELLGRSMHTGMLLSAVIGVLLGLLGIVASTPMLRLLETPEELIDLSSLYLQVYFLGLPANIIYNFGAAILRSFGDSKRPMYILTITGLVNVLLNLFFVIVLKMDVAGVALATTIAQVISAIWILWILFTPKDAYQLSFKSLGFHKESLQDIVKIGVPNSINGMLFSISNLVIQASINSFQDTTILAGKTAAIDIGAIICQVIAAFTTACLTFSAQCVGAKKYKRVDELAVKTIFSCGAVMLFLSLLVTMFPSAPIRIFNDNPEVIKVGSRILLIMCWSYLIYMISDIFINCSRGFGRSLGVTIMNVIGMIVPRLIWVWFLFPMCRTIEFLFLCYPFSYIFSSAFQVVYYIRLRKKMDKQLSANIA